MASLKKVFNSDSHRLLDAHIAQLCVLYEDLRIEVSALREESMPSLDVLDPAEEHACDPARTGTYRKTYFLRRSTLTLCEFAAGLRLLDDCRDFAVIKSEFDVKTSADWKLAIEFFRKNEPLIKNVRNDIGGHFGFKAATWAVCNLGANSVGGIEVILNGRREPTTPHLNFAGEIAAVALGRHLNTLEEFLSECVVKGYFHAVSCVDTLVVQHLWPRFG